MPVGIGEAFRSHSVLPFMSLPRRSRRPITLLAPCVLALTFAVALWATGYKMEQYPQHGQAFRVMPPAMLLTERERPVRVRGPQSLFDSADGRHPLLLRGPAWFALLYRSRLAPRPA